MPGFLNAVIISLAVGIGVTLLRAKPGERLRESLHVTLAILAISFACGVAALLGVEIAGISN
jgi:hypothetical protein